MTPCALLLIALAPFAALGALVIGWFAWMIASETHDLDYMRKDQR